MDFPAHIARMESHCRALAGVKGCHEYVIDKVSVMAKEHPMFYGHLPKIVQEAIAATLRGAK